jgi:glycosyltransferase involved in cell wall biosynthesis
VEESWVVADEDSRDLVSRVPAAHVEIIPNGIVRRWGLAGLEGPKGPVALFLGNLTVAHNADAARYLARDIWPLVRRRIPDARLKLVGAHGATVARLATRPGVSLPGFVEDLSPLLREARLAVAPLRCASGIQNKVLETMAAGLPAVVTPMVGRPIGAEPGREIVVAEGAGALADEIVRLFADEALARRIGEAGSAHVTSRFSWDRAGERMRELLA